MTLNTGYYLLVHAFITLILCGSIQYFTGIQFFYWLPFFLNLGMVLLHIMHTDTRRRYIGQQEVIILGCYLAFATFVVISTLLKEGVLITLVAFKNELAMSLVMVCLILGFCHSSQVYFVTRSLYYLFYIQIPLILYQMFVIVPQRVLINGEEEKWDSVVGSFGGDPMGGGNTATMGLFCLLIMLLKISEYKHGVATFKSTAIHLLLGFFFCIVGEVKFVILLSPLFLLWVWITPGYISDVKKIQLKHVIILLVILAILIFTSIMVLAYFYSVAFEGTRGESYFTIFIDSLSYIFDPEYIMANGELGRFSAILFWYHHSDLWGISGPLFGYGLSATNSGGSVASGFLNPVYNLILDTTSLSILLWEVGVIGFSLFLGLYFYIIRVSKPVPLFAANQLDKNDTKLMSFVPAYNVFAVSCLISIPYSQDLMISPMLGFLFYFSLGSALVIRREILAK